MNCKDFLSEVTTHLTGEIPEVRVAEDEYGAVITLSVRGNVSALIGKQGTIIDAVRTLTKAIGYNGLHRIKLRIHED